MKATGPGKPVVFLCVVRKTAQFSVLHRNRY